MFSSEGEYRSPVHCPLVSKVQWVENSLFRRGKMNSGQCKREGTEIGRKRANLEGTEKGRRLL